MFTLFDTDWLLFGKTFKPSKSPKFASNTKFWSPIYTSSLKDIATNIVHLQWRTKQLETASIRLNVVRYVSIILGISSIIFLVFFVGALQVAILAGVIFLSPYFGVMRLIRNIKKDIVKYEIAKSNGWLYDPAPNSAVGFSLSTKFPSVLKSGNCNSQSVDDQFWGSCKLGSNSYPFYSGLYSYVQETRTSKSRSRHTYYSYFFCFKLPAVLESQFLLSPENVFSRLFSSKEINVESIAFNKAFAFSYDGKKGDKAISIVRSLSPSVQESLVHLSKLKSNLHVLFEDNTVLFSFKGHILKKPKSKVLGGVNLAQGDVDEITYYLDEYTKVFTEIAKYLK